MQLILLALLGLAILVFILLSPIFLSIASKRRGLLVRILIWMLGIGPAVRELLTPRALMLKNSNEMLAAFSEEAANQPLLWFSRILIWGLTYVCSLGIICGVRKRIPLAGFRLWLGVFLFSLGSLIASLAGTQPAFKIGLFFIPVVFTTVFLLPAVHPDWFVAQAKRVLLIYIYGSLIAAIVAPTWAFQVDYEQSFFSGFNFRLFGVTPQANILGPLVALYLILEIFTFTKAASWKWLNISASVIVLALTQAKTAWLIAIAGLVIKQGYEVWVKSKPISKFFLAFGVLTIFVFIASVVPDNIILSFISPKQAESLSTMTGRTEVWEVSLNAWKDNPIFGYGPNLWDLDFRLQFGNRYIWVGQAHNQLIQSLAEAGIVGLSGIIIYALVLLWYGFSYMRFTHGLSLALVILMLARSISEANFRNYNLDPNFFIHFVIYTFLLLVSRQAIKVIKYEGYKDSCFNNLPQSARKNAS